MEKCALRFTFSQVFPPKCVSFLGIAGEWCRNRLRWIINYTPLPTWCCVIAWHCRYLEFSKVFHCDRFALRCRRTKCCVKMSNTANVCLSLRCPVYIQRCVYSITTKVEAKWPWPLLDSCILSFPPNRWNTVCIASRQGNPWTNVITTLLAMWLFFLIFHRNVTVRVTRSDTLSSTTKASETRCQNHFRNTVIATQREWVWMTFGRLYLSKY